MTPNVAHMKLTLLAAQLEIRQLIHAFLLPKRIHVCCQQKNLMLLQCEETDTSHDSDGAERQTSGDWSTDSTWARLLASTWPPLEM